jgi:hypothetical protein
MPHSFHVVSADSLPTFTLTYHELEGALQQTLVRAKGHKKSDSQTIRQYRVL